MAIATINPATGETLKTYNAFTADEIEEKLERSRRAFETHRRTTFAERARAMTRLAELIEREKRELGELMTTEMGKPVKAAIEEALKCARACRFYAEHAESFLADETVETDADQSFIRHLPIGCVLAIMPWNFPFWQVFRFLAPALDVSGNAAIQVNDATRKRCSLRKF
jgi:succinate-semialdehyde dehydrogenase/glutarate-semialdehyde dehydrogenase